MNQDVNKDLEALAGMFFAEIAFFDGMEYGYVGLDCKRPFGNSSVERDILEGLDIEPDENGDYTDAQHEYAATLYRQKLAPYLSRRWIELSSKD